MEKGPLLLTTSDGRKVVIPDWSDFKERPDL
jgi:hypothetical protein